MNRTAFRVLTSVLTVGLVAVATTVGFLPLANAATDQRVTPTTEAWFQPNPSCAQATGCLGAGAAPAPTSPYPAGTMHVGYAAGQETARSYLALPLAGLDGTLERAVLDVPLDVASGSGSRSPETALLQVCLFSGELKAVEGSVDAPPKVDCGTAAPVSYVATPKPHLHADLSAVLPALPSATGVVLLPDATKAAPTDSWRIVFSAHTRSDAAKTAPATTTVTVAAQAVAQTPAQGPAVEAPAEGYSAPVAVAPPLGTGFAPPPPMTPSTEAPATSPELTPETVNVIPIAAPQVFQVGYAYPVIWLLPLAFLVLIPATAKALSKDLAPDA